MKVGEHLLLFGSETSVFPFAV